MRVLVQTLGLSALLMLGCGSSTGGADGGPDQATAAVARLDPTRYDQRCAADQDCAVVLTAVCVEEGCGCMDGAVAVSAKVAYQAAFDAARAQCPKLVSCATAAACKATTPRCLSGACVAE